MSKQTQIVVLHMKEIIYTALLVFFVLLLLVFLFLMFTQDHADLESQQKKSQPQTLSETDSSSETPTLYQPGVYHTSIALQNSSFDVEVTVDQNHINAISLTNQSESVSVLYPLVTSSFEQLKQQILDTQTLEGISVSNDCKYTASLLLESIHTLLERARSH